MAERLAIDERRSQRSLDDMAAAVTGRWAEPTASKLPLVAALALGVVCGSAVAFGGVAGVVLGISLVGCGAIVYDFRIGVVLLIVLMPIAGSAVFPHQMFGITGLNPLNLLLAATLGAYLLGVPFDRGLRFRPTPPLVWLYLTPIVVAGALGAAHAEDIVPTFYALELIAFDDAFGYLRDMVIKPLLMVVFAFLVAAAVARSAKPQLFLVPIFLSIWVMAILVIAFVAASGGSITHLALSTSREFLSPLGLHANDLGRLYAMAYALLLFTWGEARGHLLRFVLLVSMLVVLAALMLTFSRAAFVAVAVVNVLYLLWRRNLRALVFLLLLVAAALVLLPAAVYERMATGFGEGFDAISAGRVTSLWLPLLPEVLKSPIIGHGLGSILWADAMQTGMNATVIGATHPHNAYLETLLDMGVIGLVALCLYFAHVWRGFASLAHDLAVEPLLRGFFQGATAGLASLLLAAMVGSSLTPKPEQALLWAAIGFMYGMRYKPQAAT